MVEPKKNRKRQRRYKKRPKLYMNPPEIKHAQGTVSSTTSSTATIDTMNQIITVGTGDAGNRIGDRYKLISIRMAGAIALADTTNVVRLTVFQWFGSQACISSYLYESTSTANDQLFGSFNRDYLRGGFIRVLYDRLFTLDAGNVIKTFKYYISGRRVKPCQMIAGSGVNGIGNVYYSIVSDSSAVVHPSYSMSYMLDYVDN